MAKIEADDAEIERRLNRLVDLIHEGGGTIHKDVSIVCEKGGLSVTAPRSVASGINILVLPPETLLPTDAFGLHLEGDEICIGTPDAKMSPLRIALMEEMIAIYNLCGKIKFHRENTLGRVFVEAPDVFKKLALPGMFANREAVPKEDFYLHDFLHARRFGAKNIEGGDEDHSHVLMPVTDFVNHHQMAAGFKMIDGDLVVARHSPIEDSDECFVSYSMMDAYNSYVNYGYLDETSAYLLSIPFQLFLPGIGSIQIRRSASGKGKKIVPPVVKDLSKFFPQIMRKPNSDEMIVTTLIVPDQRTPRALRRILSVVLNPIAQKAGNSNLKRLILEAERQILDRNREYYNQLAAYASSVEVAEHLRPIVRDAVRVAKHQIAILDAYEVNIDQLGGRS